MSSKGSVNNADKTSESSRLSRVLLLECRVERLVSVLSESRNEADKMREKLAESATREIEQTKRISELQEELAEASAEIMSLHRRVDQGDAFYSELEEKLFENSDEGNLKYGELKRSLIVAEQRIAEKDRALENMRARLEQISASRERLFQRVSQWHRIVGEEGPEAVDLAEFIAELRSENLLLEQERRAGEEREDQLHSMLARVRLNTIVDQEKEKKEEKEGRQENPEVERDLLLRKQCIELKKNTMKNDKFLPNGLRRLRRNLDSDAGQTNHKDAVSTERKNHCIRENLKAEDSGEQYMPEHTDSAVNAYCEMPASSLTASLEKEILKGDSPSRLRAARRLLDIEGSSASGSITAALVAAGDNQTRASLLGLLGKTGDSRAATAVKPWLQSTDPMVRGAAYEASCRLLQGKEKLFLECLEHGFADEDPKVRRRTLLSALASRVFFRHLLKPLLEDRDQGVRRLARNALSHQFSNNSGRALKDGLLKSNEDNCPVKVEVGRGKEIISVKNYRS